MTDKEKQLWLPAMPPNDTVDVRRARAAVHFHSFLEILRTGCTAARVKKKTLPDGSLSAVFSANAGKPPRR